LENPNMTDTLDSLETRAPEQRERELMAPCRSWWRAPTAPGWARILDGVNAADITSRAALASCR
jgi:phenylacetate-CoA ligase